MTDRHRESVPSLPLTRATDLWRAIPLLGSSTSAISLPLLSLSSSLCLSVPPSSTRKRFPDTHFLPRRPPTGTLPSPPTRFFYRYSLNPMPGVSTGCRGWDRNTRYPFWTKEFQRGYEQNERKKKKQTNNNFGKFHMNSVV